MPYNKPFYEPITTTKLCDYGCNQTAKYKFKSEKYCCSEHYNSCPGKRTKFSKSQDHKENARKSLNTRTRLGITKSSRIKAVETMRREGTFETISRKLQQRWKDNPWDNNPYCPILKYKNINLVYQGTYEFKFLEDLERKHGIDWIVSNVSRGPAIYYEDENNDTRLYISDFQIGNTIYEIKSQWNWDHKGINEKLRKRNCNKLNKCLKEGYDVVLVLEGDYIRYGN